MLSGSLARRVLLLLTALLAGTNALAEDSSIEGCWISTARDGVIEIRPGEDDALRGRVVGVADPLFTEGERAGEPLVDLNNPDVTLRARSIASVFVVEGLRRRGDRWRDGRLYDPRTGKRFSARASLGDDGTLRIRGYVGIPLFGVTLRWEPLSADAARAERMIEALAPWRPEDVPAPAC